MTPVQATIWLTFMILGALATFGGGVLWMLKISNADPKRKQA